MRKYYLPLTVLGVAGLAALVLSERVRDSVRSALSRLEDPSEPFRGWNDAAEREVEKLQDALQRLASTLQAVR